MNSPHLLSRRADSVQPSSTLAINEHAAELRRQGRDIINLGAGEPDSNTPEHICEAAVRAIHDGQTKYTPVAGTPALRAAVAAKLERDNRLSYDPSQVIVSAGCKHSIINAMLAVIDPGDEVIICSPYWTSYPDMVALAGGQPVYISTDMASGFKVHPDQLRACISDNTRMLILNSPSNPTGQVYTGAELEALAAVILEHPGIVVISDDVYEHLVWGQNFANVLNVCPDLSDRTIVCNGVSKAYAMTGWRIGYAAGPEQIIGAMIRIQSQSTSSPCSIAQAAALAALTDDQQAVRNNAKIFQQRHDLLIGRLEQMPGVSCLPSRGTFYMFPDFTDTIENMPDAVGGNGDMVFAQKLLSSAGLAIVPGSAFGAPNFSRLSFATDQASLQKAMDRLEQFLNETAGS